jgi:hypothetical protein
MVIAVAALIVALGGTSYAVVKLPRNSVGTRQIRKRAVTLSKINAGARKALRGQKGQTGQTGPAGPQGLKGDTGSVDTSSFYDKAASDARFLASNGQAADSAKLAGQGPDAYQEHCPPGMGLGGQLCYEPALRGPHNVLNALADCAVAQAELPTMSQMFEVLHAPNATSAPKPLPAVAEQLLTSDFVDDLTVKAPMASSNSMGIAGTSTSAATHRWFCVAYPHE